MPLTPVPGHRPGPGHPRAGPTWWSSPTSSRPPGPLLAALDADGGDPMERVHDAVAALAGEGTGLWMAAVGRAEEHLRSWQDELPFGRPLGLARRAPVPLRPPVPGARSTTARWGELARKAEDLGWSVLTVADHFDDGPRADPRADGRGRRHHHAAHRHDGAGQRLPAPGGRAPRRRPPSTSSAAAGFELGIGAGWMHRRTTRTSGHPARPARASASPAWPRRST